MLKLPNVRPIYCQRWLQRFFSKSSPRTRLLQNCKSLASIPDSFSTILGNQWDWGQISSIVVSLSFLFLVFLLDQIAYNCSCCILDEVCGGFAVWAATEQAQFFHGRFAWSSWDVDELAMGEVRKRIDKDPYFLRSSIVGLNGGLLE